MLCKNCGEYNDDGSMYCQYCGTELESDAENYGAWNASRSDYNVQPSYGAQPDYGDYNAQPSYGTQPDYGGYNVQPSYGAQQNGYGTQPVLGAAPRSAQRASFQQPADSAASGGNIYTKQPYANSYFDGNGFQLIGWNILSWLIGIITLGLGIPWTICLKLRWETRHTVVNGKRLYFNGTAPRLFGKMILWDLILWAMCVLPFLIPFFMGMCHAGTTAVSVALIICFVFDILVLLFGNAFYTVYIKKWIVKHTTNVDDTGNYF